MNCTICGKPTRPGAALCVPCRKALKRARYESVLDVSPLQGKSGPPARSAALPQPDPLPPAATPRAILGARTTQFWTGLGVLMVGTAVAVVILHGSGTGAHPVARSAEAPVESARGVQEAAVQSRPEMSVQTAPKPAASARTNRVNDAAAPASDGAKGAASVRAATADSPRTAQKPAVAINALAEENTPIDAFGPIAQAPRRVEPPPVVKPAPPVDRWQLLAEAIARCDGDFFARVGCEQRALTQYCENYWGLVPQCPAAPLTERGQ